MGKKNKKDHKDGKGAKDAKSLVIFPALNALLQPSADYLGTELQKEIQSRFDAWKAAKAEKRAAEQVEALRKSLLANNVEEFDPTPRQQDLFEDWLEHVARLPSDDEISFLWRELLVADALGKTADPFALNLLRKLEPIEAHVLLKLFKKNRLVLAHQTSQGERQILAAIESHGAVTRIQFTVQAVVAGLIAGIMITASGYQISPFRLMEELLTVNSGRIYGAILPMFLVPTLMGALASRFLRGWSLTEVGRALVSYAVPYEAEEQEKDHQPANDAS